MFYKTPFRIKEGAWVLGSPVFPVFLVELGGITLLLEPEVSGAWETVKSQIEQLGIGKGALWVVILHEHSDHVMMTFPLLKDRSDVRIFAPSGMEKLLRKRDLMGSYRETDAFLSQAVYGKVGVQEGSWPALSPLEELKDLGAEVVALPGHSPLSYGVLIKDIFFVSDAAGYIGERLGYVPLFFYDLKMYLESIDRMMVFAGNVDALVLGHNALFYGKEAETFLVEVRDGSFRLAERIVRDNIGEEEVFASIYREEFLYYPESVIRVCAKYMVKRAREFLSADV